jgi:hypothetical protein
VGAGVSPGGRDSVGGYPLGRTVCCAALLAKAAFTPRFTLGRVLPS